MGVVGIGVEKPARGREHIKGKLVEQFVKCHSPTGLSALSVKQPSRAMSAET